MKCGSLVPRYPPIVSIFVLTNTVQKLSDFFVLVFLHSVDGVADYSVYYRLFSSFLVVSIINRYFGRWSLFRDGT